jgi:excisionase family DNA binding protein
MKLSELTQDQHQKLVERLNTKTAAYRLGVTVKKVREMARQGVIPAHKTGALLGYSRGRDWVFDSQDVEDYIMGQLDSITGGDIIGGTICKPASVIDLATRLLPFEDVDEHRIWPLAVYKLEKSDESGCVDFCALSIEGRGVMASGTYGNRAQAVEACRCDLRIRLKAVKDLEG